MLAASLLSAALVSALPVSRVEGTSTCPTPDDVAQRLAALGQLPSDVWLSVDRVGASLRVRLSREGTTGLLAERLLPANEPCDALASAAAAVAAAWASDPEAEVPGVRLPVPPAPAVESRPWRLELGADVAGEGSQTGVAPYFAVWAGLGRQGSRLSARLGFFFDGPGSTALTPGTVEWQRAGAMLEPAIRLASIGRLKLDAQAVALFSALWVTGQGFSHAQTSGTFLPGLGARLEATWPLGPTAIGLGLGPVVWLQPEQVQVVNAGTASLAQVELVLGLCLSWASGRG